MNPRTRILAIALGSVIGLVVVWETAYPVLVEPIATLDEQLEKNREKLTELEDVSTAAARAVNEYKALVKRVGGFDADRVTNRVRDRLNTLIDKHKLVADSVAPTRPMEDRKTKVQTIAINVKAVGSLPSVVGFLKDVAELSWVSRIGNVALYPTSTNPTSKDASRMNVRVPIEIKVLPQQKLLGLIPETELQPEDAMVRHQSRDYSALWSNRPFFDWVPPAPLVVKAQGTATHEGQEVTLRGTASGGEGPYIYQWSGEAVADPASQNVVVNTKGFSTGEHDYVLTVTDAAGNTATESTKIVIKPPAVPPTRDRVVDSTPKPPPVKDPRWPNRDQMQLVMMVGHNDGTSSTDELMIQDKKDGALTYCKAGDSFDGGKLLYVHQTGAVVSRKDMAHQNEERVYVYPIGGLLNQDMTVESAEEYPELQAVARQLGEKLKSETTQANSGLDGAGTGSAGNSELGADGLPTGSDAPTAAPVPGAEAGDGAAGSIEAEKAPATRPAGRRESSRPLRSQDRKSRNPQKPQ